MGAEVVVEDDAPILEAPDVHEEAPESNGVAQVPIFEEKEPSTLVEDESAPAPTEDTPLTADADAPILLPQDALQAELSDANKQVEVENPAGQVEAPSEPIPEALETKAAPIEDVAATIIDKLSTPLVEDDDDPIEVNEPKPSTTTAEEEATTAPNV